MAGSRRLRRVQPIVSLDFARLTSQLAETGDTPNVARNLPVTLQQLGRRDDFTKDRTGTQQVHAPFRALRSMLRKAVHSLDHVAVMFGTQAGLLVALVHHRDVVENILVLLQHLSRTEIDDDGELAGERRVVRSTGWHGRSGNMAAAILML